MNTGVLESRADISSLQASHVTQRWPDIPIQPVYVSRDGCFILISTLEKEPEVWMLSRSPSYWGTTELSHLHRYKSSYWAITEQSHLHRYQSPTDSLSSDLSIQFGGIDDQLVLAASRGYVNIWDRDTASLIHSLCAEDGVDYGYMSFRWNSNDPDDIMLALLQGTRFRRGKNYQSLQVWGVSQSQLQPDHPTYDQDLQNIPRNLTKPIIEGKVETANTRSFKGFMARLRRTLRAMIPL
ncbi:hypothetical protein FRC03_007537 [Tulasnella sp. 419]|nr:hypothetical protein FRC03_007537 [Tulasnella sp. 419]